MRYDFVPLNETIAKAFYGARPARSVRGYALLADDKPLVVWGLMRDTCRWVLFSDAAPEAREGSFTARRLAVKGARRLQQMLKDVPGPVHAMPDPRFSQSKAFLERVGFRPLSRGVYEWAPQQQ